MTTLREHRIKTAMDTIGAGADLYEWRPAGKPGLHDRAKLECIASNVVDALFPDHTLDNIEIDPPFRDD